MLNRLQQNKPESHINGIKRVTRATLSFLVAIFHKPYLTLNTAGTGSRGQKFTVITKQPVGCKRKMFSLIQPSNA